MVRKIDKIVVHCSATREGAEFNISDIRAWHKRRGFADVGYHYVVRLNGDVERGRPLSVAGAHVKGYNRNSIGVCYIGGLDKQGKAKDTRTDAQKQALRALLTELKGCYPDAQILGHRDLSPDRDGDGIISPHEWIKDCPCFDAKDEYKDL